MTTTRAALVSLCLALSFAGAANVHSQVPPATATTAAGATGATGAAGAAGEMQRLSDAFADVSQSVLPAVVTLRVEALREEPEGMGFPFPFPFGGRGRGDDVVRGTGSGILVRSDGVIVTNNHVVDGAERIDVHLRDGRVLRGQVLGTDPSTDLAVVKVEGQGFPTARWGDSERARVGEWVLAIGAPFGLEATVTHGVLSAKGRAGIGANAIEDYLQTDASINPGNSGGALVNLRGEVLGINTMIVGRGSGVGFAVPSRIARMVVDQIAAQGEVSRAWVGVGVQDLDGNLAETLGVRPGSGALVARIEPGSPGARAGLATGDIITRVDAQALEHSHDFVREVTAHRPGERITLQVLRGGQSRELAVVTARRPDDDREARGPQRPRPARRVADEPVTVGLEVMPVNPGYARQLGAVSAVGVTAVEPGGAADRAGLRRGDIILQADGRPVAHSGDLGQAMADGRAALLVRRGGSQRFVALRVR